MGILDPAKLAVVFVVAFLVLGPDRLPGIARRLGSTMRIARELRDRTEQEIRESGVGVEIASLARLRPTQIASRFVDDLVGEDDMHLVPGRSREPLESDAEAFAIPDGDLRPAVGLDRMLAISGPADPVHASGRLGGSHEDTPTDWVSMN